MNFIKKVTDKLLTLFILVPFRFWCFGFSGEAWPSKDESDPDAVDVAMLNPFSGDIITLPASGCMSHDLSQHELQHVEQLKRCGFIKFVFLYVWYIVFYGYQDNPFEREAWSVVVNPHITVSPYVGLFPYQVPDKSRAALNIALIVAVIVGIVGLIYQWRVL